MFPILETVFTLIFTFEVASKILFLRTKYLSNPLSLLDILVVAVGLMDWLLGMDPKVMRLLRLAKLGRGLRMMKMSKVMDNLSLILKCIAASVTTIDVFINPGGLVQLVPIPLCSFRAPPRVFTPLFTALHRRAASTPGSS